MASPSLIRTKDAARLLGISERTLHRWVERRDLPYYKIEHTLLFDPAELLDYVKQTCKVEAD